MNCDEATKLMDGYLDGELDPIPSRKIEQHLRECRNCDQAYKTHGALIRALGNATPYYKAPAELRERIRSALREEMVARSMRNGGQSIRSLFPRKRSESRTILFGTSWNWLALAATILLAAIIGWNLLPRLQRPGTDQLLARHIIAIHVSSLLLKHVTDVASSDQHTVKPWLDVN